MHSSFILSTLLAGASLISAAALPSAALPRDLSQLTENDVIVYGNGRIEIRDKSEMADLAKRYASDREMATRSLGPLPLEKKGAEAPSKIEKRCSKETIYEMNPVQTFLGWDIAMSQVIHANGASASIAVSAGYTISNSVTTSVTVGVSIESFLTETLGISYQESWTSTYTSTINYGVPNGTYAAIVSNPFTTRNSGNVYIGCIGEPTESTYFQADSFTSKSYSGLDWVDGTISLCTGDSYPLKMCIGDGTL